VAVRVCAISNGLYREGDTSRVTLPEFRAYEGHLRHQAGVAAVLEAAKVRRAVELRHRQQQDVLATWPLHKNARVRAWPKAQGLDVGRRGRLPKWITDKYDQEVDDDVELQARANLFGKRVRRER
jgi:hypothetical protein